MAMMISSLATASAGSVLMATLFTEAFDASGCVEVAGLASRASSNTTAAILVFSSVPPVGMLMVAAFSFPDFLFSEPQWCFRQPSASRRILWLLTFYIYHHQAVVGCSVCKFCCGLVVIMSFSCYGERVDAGFVHSQ